jgi:hypothetical protein
MYGIISENSNKHCSLCTNAIFLQYKKLDENHFAMTNANEVTRVDILRNHKGRKPPQLVEKRSCDGRGGTRSSPFGLFVSSKKDWFAQRTGHITRPLVYSRLHGLTLKKTVKLMN